MKNYALDVIKKVVGVVLIVGGVLGLFLPFLQGIAMIVVGAVLLKNEFILRKVRQAVRYVKRWRR